MDNNTPSNTPNEPVQPTPPTSPNPPMQPMESDQPTPPSPSEQSVESAPVDQPDQSVQPTVTDVPAPAPEPPQSQPIAPASSFGQPVDAISTPPAEPTPAFWNGTPAAPIAPGTVFGSGGPSFVDTKPKRSKKPLVLGILGALVVVVAGLVLSYFLWYQNPDKVVADGFVHMVEAQQSTETGSVVLTASGTSVTVDFNGGTSAGNASGDATIKIKAGSGAMEGLDVNAKGSVVTMKNGDVYFKVSDLQQTISAFVDEILDAQFTQMGISGLSGAQREQVKQEAMKEFQPIIDQLDNQWIRISASDLNGENSKTQQCLTDAFNMLETDKNASNELTDVYKKNKFVTVEKKFGSKNGSLGYQLKFDKDTAKKFVDQAGDTKFGKTIEKCDTSSSATKSLSDGIDSLANTFSSSTTTVWVGRFDHQITDVSFDGKAKSSSDPDVQFSLKPDFSKGPSIAAPKNAKSFKDVENSLSALGSDTGTSLPL